MEKSIWFNFRLFCTKKFPWGANFSCNWEVVFSNTVVRPALWIYGGKTCSFHLMSLPSEYKGYLQQAIFHWNIHTSEFYPQSLREKTMPIRCPQITTVKFTGQTLTEKKTLGKTQELFERTQKTHLFFIRLFESKLGHCYF